MKKREVILFVISIIIMAIVYFFTDKYAKETEKRVKEFIEQKESKED
jgi:preprotein translocase subunit YajC